MQQIHYAVDWVDVRQAQCQRAKESLITPALPIGDAAHPVDVVLFRICELS
jgi:hypothetical protein